MRVQQTRSVLHDFTSSLYLPLSGQRLYGSAFRGKHTRIESIESSTHTYGTLQGALWLAQTRTRSPPMTAAQAGASTQWYEGGGTGCVGARDSIDFGLNHGID